MLTDSDVFWIAETYLRLSADLRPDAPPDEPSVPAWYLALKQEWASTDPVPVNQGDLAQVVRGLRHATDTTAPRSDLPQWLDLVQQFLATDPDFDTAQRARYELSGQLCAELATCGRPSTHVRAFFADVAAMTAPADLLDASVLLQYAETARRVGESALDEEELRGWAAALRRHLATLLDSSTSPGRRAGLLNAAAHLSLRLNYRAASDARRNRAL